MRVLHGPQNIGGMAGVLARAQRQCGIDAYSYCLSTGSFEYSADRVTQAQSQAGTLKEWGKFFLKEGLSYDGYQFYFGTSWFGLGLKDIALLHKLRKKLYFYFCGCDIRDSKATIKKYRYSACAECWPMLCSPNRKLALDVVQKYADAVFVSTPDLLEFVPGSVLLPQPIEMAVFSPIRDTALGARTERVEGSPIQIAHAPSSQAIKGTKYLLSAVESLRSRGFPVELVLVEGKSYAEAMQICASADIVVDQLLIGAYGQYAVEMMALGKPVICYIREDLIDCYPDDLPIISADIENIESVIEALLEDNESWSRIGNQGIQYVSRYHDSIAVARKALEYY